MTLSIKQCLFIIKAYYATKLYAKVKEEFKSEYPESGNIPNSAIKHLIDKFGKTARHMICQTKEESGDAGEYSILEDLAQALALKMWKILISSN